MPQLLPRFWKALRDVPGATTDTLDWRTRLGDEFQSARHYLKSTGELATAVDCPSPGGEGCPRRVMRIRAGGYRAVCALAPAECDSISLSAADLVVLTLDRPGLTSALCIAMDASPTQLQSDWRNAVSVGSHFIAAGVSAPVILAMPRLHCDTSYEDLRHAGLGRDAAIILAPTRDCISPETRARLTDDGHQVLELPATISIDTAGSLRLVQPPAVLLAPVRTALAAKLGAATPQRVWHLPPGTIWGQLVFSLISNEVLNVTFQGQVRRIDPADFGMSDRRTLRTTNAWGFLRVLAETSGKMGPLDASTVAGHKKSKQALSKALQAAFGLSGDPIGWVPVSRTYQSLFIMRDERPQEVRAPRHRR